MQRCYAHLTLFPRHWPHCLRPGQPRRVGQPRLRSALCRGAECTGPHLCFGASTEAAATVATSMKQHDAERTTSGGVDAIENVVENMHARFSV